MCKGLNGHKTTICKMSLESCTPELLMGYDLLIEIVGYTNW